MNYLFFVFGLVAFIAGGTLLSLGHTWQGFVMLGVGILYFVSGLDGLNKE